VTIQLASQGYRCSPRTSGSEQWDSVSIETDCARLQAVPSANLSPRPPGAEDQLSETRELGVYAE